MVHYVPQFIQDLPGLLTSGGYWVLGLVVILEGLPVIGSLFPGHILIISAGFLAKIGILSLPIVLIVAGITSVLGDIIGYLLGARYGYDFLQKYGRYIFLKEERIEKVKNLVENHTRKAIIFGKFSPVTRPLMPFLVGASGIHIRKFWLYNIIGGVAWVVSSVGVGYVFGASYHVAAEYFGKFVVAGIILAILIIWTYRFVNTRFHVFKKYELFILGLNLISLWTLVKTIQDSFTPKSFLVGFDVAVNIFMNKHMTPALVYVGSVVSTIGSTTVIIGCGLIIGFAFLFKKKWRRATIMLVSVGSTTVAVTLMKELFMRARPHNALQTLTDSSFPSGHASVSAAFFLALLYIFAPRIHEWVKRETFIVLGVIAIILIGLSRLVLNVHWASDVIGGWALGVFLATGSVLLIRYLGFFFIRQEK